MKLAEALQARSDLKKQLNQLEYRMSNNALVQEGEQKGYSEAEDRCLQKCSVYGKFQYLKSNQDRDQGSLHHQR